MSRAPQHTAGAVVWALDQPIFTWLVRRVHGSVELYGVNRVAHALTQKTGFALELSARLVQTLTDLKAEILDDTGLLRWPDEDEEGGVA
jgi:hypothetical protein